MLVKHWRSSRSRAVVFLVLCGIISLFFSPANGLLAREKYEREGGWDSYDLTGAVCTCTGIIRCAACVPSLLMPAIFRVVHTVSCAACL